MLDSKDKIALLCLTPVIQTLGGEMDDQKSQNDAIAQMYERMRVPTTNAEFEQLARQSIEREALLMLEAAVAAARNGGGL